MTYEQNYFFESIHIKAFGRLKDIKLDKAGKINLIRCDGNFGKTSFLEAVGIMARPLEVCRCYNHFFEKHGDNAPKYLKRLFIPSDRVELCWTAKELEFFDRLLGIVEENGDFEGYGYYQLKNDKLGIKRFEGNGITIENGCSPFPVIADFTGARCGFYDCLSWDKLTEFKESENMLLKDYVIDLICCYNEDITDIFLKDNELYVNSDVYGEIPARLLGSFLYSCIVFYKILEMNTDEVFLIDNFDCMLCDSNTAVYVEMFLGLIHMLESFQNTDRQFFITVKNEKTVNAFSEIMNRNKQQDKLTVTVLDKIP